jgi:hypothetical protein
MQSLPLKNLSIDEPLSRYNRSPHVEPFHRQRRVDGTLSFSEQILNMQHIISTNGLDGRCINNDNVTEIDENQGGVWKEIVHTGIGQKPSIGTCV